MALVVVLGACASENVAPPATGAVAAAEDMVGFSWVIGGDLAGMPRPGRLRSLEADLAFLDEQGIALLVSLTEVPVDPAAVAAHGIGRLHLPVPDFGAPTLDQLAEFTSVASASIAAGKPVGVHCGAGLGRTGTFLAAYFVWLRMGPDEAIREIRRLRPGSIETAAQERAVHDFAARLAAGGP